MSKVSFEDVQVGNLITFKLHTSNFWLDDQPKLLVGFVKKAYNNCIVTDKLTVHKVRGRWQYGRHGYRVALVDIETC